MDGARTKTKSRGGDGRRNRSSGVQRQTRVSESPSPPQPPATSNARPGCSSSLSSSSSRADIKAKTANKHSTSVSSATMPSEPALVEGIPPSTGVIGSPESGDRNASRDESFGMSAAVARQNQDPMPRLELNGLQSGIPVYTLYVPKSSDIEKRSKGESIPEISCTLSLGPKERKPVSRTGSSSKDEYLNNVRLKSLQSPKSPKSPRDCLLQEPRLNVRELAAKYDQKVNEMQTTKPELRDDSRERLQDCPLSPATRARMVRLRRAKDDFLASKSMAGGTAPSSPPIGTTEDRSADGADDSGSSVCEVLMQRVGENCRESRRKAHRIVDVASADKQNEQAVVCRRTAGKKLTEPQQTIAADGDVHQPQQQTIAAESGGAGKTSSFFSIRLRKNRKKKDGIVDGGGVSRSRMTKGAGAPAVTALCRQSLYVNMADKEDRSVPGPKSCPASPEMKSKSSLTTLAQPSTTSGQKSKSSWLQRLKSK